MSLFSNLKPSKYVQKGRPPKMRNVFLDAKPTFDYMVTPHDIVYSNCQVSYLVLRCMGVFPFVRPSPGVTLFELVSLQVLHSAVIFILLTGYVIYVAINRIEDVCVLEGRFEEAVIAYLFLVNLLPIAVIPIVWYELRKVIKVLNDWSDFEMLYFKVTRNVLPLQMKLKSTIIAVVLTICSSISVVVIQVTMGHFKLSQVIPYCFLDTLIYMMGAYWYLACEAMSSSATILAKDLQKALRHIGPAALVSDYRALWLRLSKLARDTGTSTCYTFTFLSLYLFFIITLSIYGLMSQLSYGFGIKDIGLVVTACCSIGLLYFICDTAHNASHHIKTNFQKRLLMVELSWMNVDAQTEIKMFLRATEMYAPNINLGGFFDVNRNLFKSLLTTMVTYLVVLLQFQISLPEVPNIANLTEQNNSTM